MDKIKPILLKKTTNFTKIPMTILRNRIYSKGKYTDHFKTTLICPVYKIRNISHSNIYRSISLMSNFGKIFEKFVKARITKHLQENNILSDNYFGSRPNLSTQNALNTQARKICDSVDVSKSALAICPDLKKIF